MKIRTVVLLLIVLALGSGLYLVKTGRLFSPKVETPVLPPVVAVIAPANDATIAKNVPIVATASSSEALASLAIFIDGTKKAQCQSSPCNYSWNTSLAAEGPHTIGATAASVSEKKSASSPVKVIVQNQAPAPVATSTSTSNTTFAQKPTATTSKPASSVPTSSTATTPADPKISAVTAQSSVASAIVVSWRTNVPTVGHVEYGETSGSYVKSSANETAYGTMHSVTITGLTAGTKYYYRVVASNAVGVSTSSPESSATVGSITISSVKSNSVAATTATITWATNLNTKGYILYGTQSSSSGTYNNQSGQTTSLMKSGSVDLSGLTSNTKYYYRVVAIDDAGNKNTSIEYNFTTSLIYGVSAERGSGGVAVNWTTNTLTKGEVRYGTQSSSSTYPFTSAESNYALTHSVLLGPVDAGTKYYYRIVTVDGSGVRYTSIEYTFTP